MTELLSAADVFKTIGGIVLAIVILLIMVTVHEFGHYIAGKILKFRINEFSIGFGPAIFKRKNKKTGEQFSVRLLPLGGYCAFAGEDGEEPKEEKGAFEALELENMPTEKQPEGELFCKQSPWKRIIVLLAGPLMNYLLALLCIFSLFFGFGQYEYKIYELMDSETAVVSEYSLEAGDVISAIDGKNMYVISDYVSALNGKKSGDMVTVTVWRDGERQDLRVMLKADANFSNLTDTNTLLNALGINSMGGVAVRYGFFSTIGRSFAYSFKTGGMILQTIGELLTGKLSLTAVGGPISTIKVTSEIASQNMSNFLNISAYIGVNLAVFNLLPIPALDGSKIVLCAIEWIRKKPLNRKVEAAINIIGFVAIFGFAILVDILQFIT